jgi:hypothetical protein
MSKVDSYYIYFYQCTCGYKSQSHNKKIIETKERLHEKKCKKEEVKNK